MSSQPVITKILTTGKPSAVALQALSNAKNVVSNSHKLYYVLGGFHSGDSPHKPVSTKDWDLSLLQGFNSFNTVTGATSYNSGKYGVDCSGFVRYCYGKAWGYDNFGGSATCDQFKGHRGTAFWPIWKGIDPTSIIKNPGLRNTLWAQDKLKVDYTETIKLLLPGDILYFSNWNPPQTNNLGTAPNPSILPDNDHTAIYAGILPGTSTTLGFYGGKDIPTVLNAYNSQYGIRATSLVDAGTSSGYLQELLAIKRVLQ